jgi:1,4-dihydroxy-2-naphthoyl-CoA hydrolase
VTIASEFNARGADRLPGFLGMDVRSASAGASVVALDVQPHHLAPNGFLHGGSVVALADTAAGVGCLASLPEGADGFTTIELKTNFVGTATSGVVRADASIVHGGRTTQVWDVDVRADGTEKLIATFRCTQMVLWPRG